MGERRGHESPVPRAVRGLELSRTKVFQSRRRRLPPDRHRRESVASTEPLATIPVASESRPSRLNHQAAAATARTRSISAVVCPIHLRPPASAASSKVRAQRLSRPPNPEPTRNRVASPREVTRPTYLPRLDPRLLVCSLARPRAALRANPEPPVAPTRACSMPQAAPAPYSTFAAWGRVLLLLGLVDPSVLGIPLGITKDQLVPTEAHVARVRGRASLGAEAEVGTRASWRVTKSDRGGP
ncbi:hypothetical protein E5676_scaffold359G00070 [Cucumis melo var. makuwa]|uniref:Uncharacterized protein n=1 Tax=Cucumis melo var. makuwa TaxID=1194695 RepID=A0A5A7SU43_CUCMM|nr:hypothetical protein E6C27_scaffold1987G00080 [Cucumis melo var. makuwa]TYK21203.1 hypothetical protein E5676_scaffold359G00070 [Cucumis melo var. makuwa]